MITTFLILSAMFLVLFVLDIPLVFVVYNYGNTRQVFGIKLLTAFMVIGSVVCILATLGLYFG